MPLSRRHFLSLSVFAIAAHRGLVYGADKKAAVPRNLDHILLGASDLDRGIAWFEERSGVRAMIGGVHPGRGTRNAIAWLGPRRYLEIIAPDPAQAGTTNAMVDALRALPGPRLVGWAAHTGYLDGLLAKARAAGVATEDPHEGARARPDGQILHWKSFNLKNDYGGVLPFFIQWSADSVHPSEDAPKGCSLLSLLIASPAATDVAGITRKLGLDVEVDVSKTPGLKARIAGKKGTFEVG